jgi:hypothetical protein
VTPPAWTDIAADLDAAIGHAERAVALAGAAVPRLREEVTAFAGLGLAPCA